MTTRNRSRLRCALVALVALLGVQTPLAAAEANAASWSRQPSLQTARGLHGVAEVGGRIFVFGGYDPGSDRILGSVEVRPARPGGAWRYSTPEPSPRANAAAAELRGFVYLVGGEQGEDGELTDVVDRFDPRSGTWSPSVPLPGVRTAAGVASLNGLLYVAGGFVAGDKATGSVVVFDPVRRTWRSVAPMPTPRARLKMVTVDGRLYAVGGLTTEGDSLSTVERYDPASDRWSTVASLAEQRVQPGVVAVEHHGRTVVAAVGGARTKGADVLAFLRSTEIFDPRTGRWQTLKALLPVGKAGLACAVQADGAVLAIGGAVLLAGGRGATADVYALKLADHHR
ncbi:MAG: kelch repeat-containing protein [Umezawaea sp.]